MYRRRKRKKRLIFLFAAVILILFILFKSFFRANAAVRSVAEAKLRTLSTEALNSAVLTSLYKVSYSELVYVERDGEGNILSISADFLSVNKLARETAASAQENIDSMGDKIYIPLGAFSGIDLFYGSGPAVAVKILPVGRAECSFFSSFTQAGINQTKHSIYINLAADVSVLMLNENIEFSLSADVLVSECVLVGEVPEVYIGSDIF